MSIFAERFNMCQFAKLYPIKTVDRLLSADRELTEPTPEKIYAVIRNLNEFEFTQEPPAQIQIGDNEADTIMQEIPAQLGNIQFALTQITQQPVAQIEAMFTNSPLARINWASQIALMDSKLPLGSRYWHMKQAVENGWSSTILKIQIETNLFQRQVARRYQMN